LNKQKTKRNIKRLTYQLVKSGRIKTSVPRAKKVRSHVEKLITRAKKDTVANRRYVAAGLPKETVNKLFEIIGPANKDRPGGYTRILRIGNRKGDGSKRCMLEIIDNA
jgi:large subunit ribosomal protein L17